ncbi:response regulator, partial [bacterium]|nr:response regulator [bacterium]
MKLLLVDDEVKLLEALTYALKKKGYVTDTATDGDMGLELAMSGFYDIIVLDRMLPGLNGMDILQTLRKHSINTPVLFLTARDSA